MFGKPEWFRRSRSMRPTQWQGWVYLAGWLFAIAAPCMFLLARNQGPEATVWAALLAGLLGWDLTKLRQTNEQAADRQILYIGDDGAAVEHVA